MLKHCLQCKKEYEAQRETSRYCSSVCRKLAFLSVPLKDQISVPEISVPLVSVPKTNVQIKEGHCHACGVEGEKWLCICLGCIQKGITHKSLGLDILNCGCY